jgi:hypothetical protein
MKSTLTLVHRSITPRGIRYSSNAAAVAANISDWMPWDYGTRTDPQSASARRSRKPRWETAHCSKLHEVKAELRNRIRRAVPEQGQWLQFNGIGAVCRSAASTDLRGGLAAKAVGNDAVGVRGVV